MNFRAAIAQTIRLSRFKQSLMSIDVTHAFSAGALGLTACFVGAWCLTSPAIPSYQNVRAQYRSSEQWVADRNGLPLGQIRADPKSRRLGWLPLSEVSPALTSSLIATEDHRFYQHHGVDWRALGASLFESTKGIFSETTHRGASTLSMQLASLVTHDSRLAPGHRSMREKFRQIRLAFAMENSWTKSEILEAYLNLVNFRGELQGLNSASRILFEKNPHGLSTGESAILVSLLRAPNAKWSLVQKRACRADPADCLEIGQKIIDLQARDGGDPLSPQLAPHLAYRLSKLFPNQEWIESTIDIGAQREALRLASEQLSNLSNQNVHDVAALAVDNETGEVLAYVGNTPEFSSARHIDGIQVRRQAGSTLKPFLYGAAFEKNILAPNSLLSDIPFELDTGRGIYRPENYDHRFRGAVSVRDALASSMNIPAVRTLTLVTPDDFVEWLTKLGFTNLNSGEDYGVSLALGTADVSLWEMVRAYRTLANKGWVSDLQLSKKTANGLSQNQVATRVFSEVTSFRISQILSDREARSATFGLENPLATRYWTAVKTGTSKDMRDNWCIGYSSRYTVGVWVGNFNGEAMWNVSGISGAAPIWIGLMNYLHNQVPSVAPVRPPMADDDDAVLAPIAQEEFHRIVAPTDGSVVAWDPDIPKSRQKILFRSSLEPSPEPHEDSSDRPASDMISANSGRQKLSRSKVGRWQLDQKILGPVDHAILWEPVPGAHRLDILKPNGEIEDTVSFVVRGRLRRPSPQASQPSSKSGKSL